MTDERLVLDRRPLTDEAVRRDLAAGSDRGVLLDLDEGPDLRLLPYGAPVMLTGSG